jgi:4,5-DOPA dioxygenase extradiol
LKTDKKRGYDHGVFIPMMVMYPEIKVPVVQISILKSMDPEAHFRMGVAMRGLKKEGFLILGSGSSVHGSFFEKAGAKWSQSFDQELTTRIVSSKNEEDLLNICRDWRKLPNAKQMHPR